MSKDEKGYNGWANYETWNVALWIGNDEGLYYLAQESRDYEGFKQALREGPEDGSIAGAIAYETPDHVAWNDSGLDVARLDEMIDELKGRA